MSRIVKAARAAVYRALLDREAVAKWKVPNGMTCRVLAFDGREGGAFRVSLSYDVPTNLGKTSQKTDTYHGHLARLVPGERVIEIMEFETSAPEFQGEMTLTWALRDVEGGTEIVATHDGLPAGVTLAHNELGHRMALAKLAALLEANA